MRTRVTEEVDITFGTIVKETYAAILLRTTGGQQVWVPLSQVSRITRIDGGPVVRMTAWIAREKGFI